MAFPGTIAPIFGFADLTRIFTLYCWAPEFVNPVVSIVKVLPYRGSIVAIARCVVELEPLPPDKTAALTP
jgi:hypothetical protein